MELTFTQCKQINDIRGYEWRDVIESMCDQPEWITQELDIADIQAIQQGGCASGAYMPAVTYWQARETMGRYGDDVLDYLEQIGYDREVTLNLADDSWGGFCCKVLSMAVEIWCGQFDLDGVDWD